MKENAIKHNPKRYAIKRPAMFLRHRYLLSSVLFWPVLPIVLMLLYDMSGMNNAPFWQSFLMYAVCIVPALIMFVKHIKLLQSKGAGISYKLLTAGYSALIFASVGWLLFMAVAPRGWD
jgi:hypothetical protein